MADRRTVTAVVRVLPAAFGEKLTVPFSRLPSDAESIQPAPGLALRAQPAPTLRVQPRHEAIEIFPHPRDGFVKIADLHSVRELRASAES